MIDKRKGKGKVQVKVTSACEPWWPLSAGAYPGFFSMKRLGVFLLSTGWNASSLDDWQQQKPLTYGEFTWGSMLLKDAVIKNGPRKTKTSHLLNKQKAEMALRPFRFRIRFKHGSSTPL